MFISNHIVTNNTPEQHESNDFQRERIQFYFLSNEEERIHIHVTSEAGEVKFWLEPIVPLAVYYRLNQKSYMKFKE